jgi:acetyltransferase EpsM
MLIYGAGGHAQVVWEALESKEVAVVGVFDDAPKSALFRNLEIQHPYQADFYPSELLIIAIGNNFLRTQVCSKVKHSFGQAIHAKAYISPTAILEEGIMVMANATIQAHAKIGKHSLLNTACIIEHDVMIGDFVHIASGAVLGGEVSIDDFTLVGLNASILPAIKVGKNCLIGAGAVVTKDIPDNSTVWGNPAKIMKQKN